MKASASSVGGPRIFAAYVVAEPGRLEEGSYLPQAAAAYFPTAFSVSAKERRLSFDTNLSYRVVSKSDLSSGVLVYTIEAPAPGGAAEDRLEGCRTFSFSFPRSALGGSEGIVLQPAPYALERAIRMSELAKGVVRLESLRYDESSRVFKASVSVSGQSITR